MPIDACNPMLCPNWGVKAMKDAPWAIIVSGTGNVTEHKLADQGGGSTLAVLAPSIVVKSNAEVGKSRTVVVTRALKGAGPDYYTFDIAKLAYGQLRHHLVPNFSRVSQLPHHPHARRALRSTLVPIADRGLVIRCWDQFGAPGQSRSSTPTATPPRW